MPAIAANGALTITLNASVQSEGGCALGKEVFGPAGVFVEIGQLPTVGKVSLAIYVVGVALAFIQPIASVALYVTVAAIWFIPDRRVERVLNAPDSDAG